ncbi:hypothetical protein DL767_002144 [Monosporascus sp. MG133]|nr:hypothetical protein DL767_002144 [Monosporascus sp. MG133]
MTTHEAEAVAQAKIDSTEYFLFQDDKGALTARIREGKGASLSAPEPVGSAKRGAPVTLTVNAAADKNKVLALAMNGDGVLQDFIYDDIEGEWKLGNLRNASVAAREDAEFTAASDKTHTYVFAVTKPNQIGGIVVTSSATGSGGFSPPKTLSVAHPAQNASLFAVAVDGTINAFYSHADSSIHKLTLVNGEWQDSQIQQTNDGTKKFNIAAAAKAGGGGYTLQWANDKQEVFSLLADGKLIKYGDITNEGAVKKTSEAQAWYYEEEVIIIRRRRRWWC